MSTTQIQAGPDAPASRSLRRSPWYHLRQGFIDAALWIVGVIGALSLVAAIAAQIGGYSIVLFSTGSMSPTIPAGSASLVQRIPASDIRVGDVVTVDRHDALPVTHRVISKEPQGDDPRAFIIRMKGDANTTEDVNPYQVTEVRRVIYSVPGVAALISRAREPWVVAALTAVAALLVTWAFWPSRRRNAPTRAVEDTELSEQGGSSPQDEGVS